MNTRKWIPLLLVAAVAAMPSLAVIDGASAVGARDLTFEQRVRAQEAIEQVYWSHRIWPPENQAVKPPLSEVMPAEAIRAKVADYLKKSNALAENWGKVITAQDLQAEMDRMARDTRKPEMLREIFTALGNDPFVIAECLARPNVADRFFRDSYARDERFHGQLRRQADDALASDGSIAGMKNSGGEYREVTWSLVQRPSAGRAVLGEPENGLNQEQWDGMLQGLRSRFGSSTETNVRPRDEGSLDLVVRSRPTPAPQALPLGAWTRLQQDDNSFWVTAVLVQGADFVKVATVTWPKTSFDAWWHEKRALYRAGLTAPFGPYELVAPLGGTCTDDTWTATSAGLPAPALSHSAVWTGTEMIVWGGYKAGTRLNTGARYNPSTDTFTPISTGANVPEGRSAHTAVWTGTEMIVWGGNDGTVVFNTGGRYNPSTDSWSSTSTLASPSPRNRHATVWTGSVMIVWGGNDTVGYFNTGGRYDPSSDTWAATSTGTSVPDARAAHTAVWTGSVMVIWGGAGTGPAPITGGRYNPATDTWLLTSTGANVPAARLDATAVWTGSVMIVWGGWSGTALSSGGRYNPTTNSWLTMSASPSARSLHTAVWTGSRMVIWGGNSNSSPLRTGSRYDPSLNTWSATAEVGNVPAARSQHTAIWTGTEMIVWGGAGPDDNEVNSGGRYDPSTNAWTPTRLYHPEARGAATTVWTGAEMIVWGGQVSDGSTPINSGGRYDPATDVFSPTSLTGAPSGRARHSAVWTGSEMIVWGGSFLSSGGRYSPATDAWVATRTTGAPEGRDQHVSVWTGTEMIVWGGLGGSLLNNGGRYDPVANSWTATSLTNAPNGRYGHASVWTGTEMIVWGGTDGIGGYSITGGRYDPVADTWTATSTGANVPDGRFLHTAVWTGSRMIVWGGFIYESSTNLNSGGRYDPSTDTWAPTSTGANVPAARYGHTSVWTGSEMIVWGGLWSPLPDSSGGRYEPVTDSWRSTSTSMNVPSPRWFHAAAWTGSEMIVWSGFAGGEDGARYCAVCSAANWYRDADGDGYGVGTDVVLACAQPAGYVATTGDCNDGSAASHPGAAEICDGIDNDCDTVADNVALPGAVADLVESKSGGAVTISWTSPFGAQLHDVVRGQLGTLRATGGDFAAATTDCLANDVAGTSASDPVTPAPGDGFWHLVRGSNCGGPGTYDDGTPDQSGARDAEIAASSAACP